MSYKIADIEGIGPAYAEKLAACNINTTDDFLKLCCSAKGRDTVAEQTGLSATHILTWANMADLMRVSGIGPQFAELLKASGVDTVKELRTRNADNLADKLNEINAAKNLTKGKATTDTVQGWINAAKDMDPMITH
jgi:predicted flap endonuclease-1-like 5' DNA nuclease